MERGNELTTDELMRLAVDVIGWVETPETDKPYQIKEGYCARGRGFVWANILGCVIQWNPSSGKHQNYWQSDQLLETWCDANEGKYEHLRHLNGTHSVLLMPDHPPGAQYSASGSTFQIAACRAVLAEARES